MFKAILLAACVCAVSQTYKIQPRIFNGLPADQGQFPFFVFLEIDPNNHNKQACGGTLVGDRHVVTAAHCVDKLVENIRLHFGVYETRNKVEDGRKIVTVSRADVTIHPSFSRTYMRDDVAIIKMNEPIEFNRFIQPAKFSNDCEMDEYTDGMAIGAGYYSTNGDLANYLQWAPMSIVPREECSYVFPAYGQRSETFCVNSQDMRSMCKVQNNLKIIPDLYTICSSTVSTSNYLT